MEPLVSILIPAYNAAPWVAETLQSAIAQTWQRKEIILIDDGSTDETLSIARRFSSATIRVETQRNQGAAAARNTALSLAQGDFVQWLDADDLLGPGKIEQQMGVALDCSPRTLISGPFASFLYRKSRAVFRSTPLCEDLVPVEWLLRKLALDLHMQTGTWLVSRELTQAAGPWDTTLQVDDDGEYFCRVLLQSDGVRFVPEARVYYRASGCSLSYIGRSNEKKNAQWRSMAVHIRSLLSMEDSPRTHAACVRYLQNWLIYFYPERMDLVREARAVAATLGGELLDPRLSWKYDWIRATLGWRPAIRVQGFLRMQRWRFAAACDRVAWRLEQFGQPHASQG